MTGDDLMTRARLALQPAAPRGLRPVGFDRAKGAELLARAQVAIAAAPKPEILVAAAPPRRAAGRGKLVVAIDATGSRITKWDDAKTLQDRVLKWLPGEVALAVYGNDLHTFTPFTSNRRKLRALAADICCEGGTTRLLEILTRVVEINDASAVIYITDTFEEFPAVGRRIRRAAARPRHPNLRAARCRWRR